VTVTYAVFPPISNKTLKITLIPVSYIKLVSRKKKTYGYQERCKSKRQEFIVQIAQLNSDQIVYIHESGMDSRDDYRYG